MNVCSMLLALIYPFSYEKRFRISVIEAMKAGCLVVDLINTVINEIASNQHYY
jgi:hypothetical protein